MAKYKNGTDITDVLQKDINSSDSVNLPEGEFTISRTILVRSNVIISGEGDKTRIFLNDAVNSNMFTNSTPVEGNENITFKNISLDGNISKQFKPETQKKLSFCNMFYFANTSNIEFTNITGVNCYQTVLHFNKCQDIKINGLIAKHIGWSGISTSGSNNITATNIYIYDSGNDHRHSAIHLDGGTGAFIQGDIDRCVGNGVMLDATFSPFSHAVVTVNCSNCMRGVSLIGSPEKTPKNILIQGGVMKSNQIGVMISNASHSFIDGVLFLKNSEYGLLFQGRVGGNHSVVSRCKYTGNTVDIKEIHNSKGNFFY